MSLLRAWPLGCVTGVALVLLPAFTPPAGAYPFPYPPHAFYLTYQCPDWKETPPLPQEEAEDLRARLARFGAETELLGQGVAVDNPEFPVQVFRLLSVRYRLTTPKELVTTKPWQGRRWQAELQSLGFDVALAVDRPNPPAYLTTQGPPGLKGSPVARLPAHTTWTGVIRQEGKPLPARLVLDRQGDKIRGELSFHSGDQSYRVRVRGALQGDTVSFTSYEALAGRLYIPTEYQATVQGTSMTGKWRYAPEGLEGEMEFTLDAP